MADLKELFARLAKPSDDGNQQQSSIYHQPSVSSPIYSPSPSGPQPHHVSAVLSPNTSAMNTPALEPSGSTRATDLLSLLKFRPGAQPASSTTPPTTVPAARSVSQNPLHPQPDTTGGAQGRSISAAEIVAGFTRKTPLGSMQSPSALVPTASRPDLRGEASGASSNPQEFLLKLLNQGPKPPMSDASSFTSSVKQSAQPVQSIEDAALEADVDDLAQDFQDAAFEHVSSSPSATRGRDQSPMHLFGEDSAPLTTFDGATKPKLFTYVNPFEQLSASSPRNRTPKPDSPSATQPVEILKHARDSSNTSGPAAKARKVSPDASSSTPQSPSVHHETVSQALSGVGEVVDKQVEQALADLTLKANGDSEPTMSETEKAVHEAAAGIQDDLKDEATRQQMEAGMPKAMAEAFEATINAVAETPAADEDWEEAAEKDVRVFNFPMQPFVSIDIKQLDEPPLAVSPDLLQDIAKMKKEFDQIDRNLVTASQNFMVYPLKNGGLRVIRQEDGSHKQVFSSMKERIFNVALSTTKKGAGSKEIETVLATGVNGTVFWAPLANFARDEFFGQSEEERGFIFPPVPTNDENTSGGQLKTRVKPTSRNPDFFAYGRGKSIYLIWPSIARTSAYCDPDTRVCDSEKYLQQHMFKISTGKAGKDFIFSADDTVIISLDKVGRLKFWDIRSISSAGAQDKVTSSTPLEVKVPLMTLATCLPTEKSWPTSVLLLDKEKPMAKGIALRYVIVGMKQNHTLQIWDLSLGKPVQEINFPHKQESDGICSLAYHPRSGILAVGHPTRNSIYFLHVSAPQYNLPPMSQAKYVSMLAAKDKTLPTPASTIIISGIREYTLGTKGTIRSLDMLTDPGEPFGSDAPPLFVLYIMHSRGISEMRVNRQQLGWTETGKIINQVNATKVGAITVNQIKPLPSPISGDAASVASEPPPTLNTPAAPTPSKPIKEVLKKAENTPSKHQKAVEEATVPEPAANGDKPEKKKRKDKKGSDTASHTTSTAPSPFVQPTEALSRVPEAEQPKSPSPAAKTISIARASEAETAPNWGSRLMESTTTSAQLASTTASGSVADISGIVEVIKAEFDNLTQNLSQDRLQQEAVATSRQEGVLKIVSRTLSENVEDSLSRVVTDGLAKIMLSPLKEVVASTIDRNLSTSFNQALKIGVPRELEKALPVAMSQILQDQGLLRNVSELVAKNVAQQVDAALAAAVRDTVMPTFQNLAISAAEQMSSDVEQRFKEQLRQAEAQHQSDNVKIDHLLKVVTSLQETIQTMGEENSKFQEETKALLRQVQSAPQSREPVTAEAPQTPPHFKSPEEAERDNIKAMLEQHNYSDATLQWMHSRRKIELFDELFANVNPNFLPEMSSLLHLSVAAAVTDSLDSNTMQRLGWLDACLNLLTPVSEEIADVLPKVLEVLQTRLQQAYMVVSERNHQDPSLRNIAVLHRRVQELKL